MKALVDLRKILTKTEYTILVDVQNYSASSVRGRHIRIGIPIGTINRNFRKLVSMGLISVNKGKYKSIAMDESSISSREVTWLANEYRRKLKKWVLMKDILSKRMHCFSVWELMKIREFENIQ